MKKKAIVIMVLSTLIFVMAGLSSYAATYTVCPAGPPACDYTTIQTAINAAVDPAGDVIHVAAGTYPETLDINKPQPITIIGDDRSTVIIDASSSGDYAIYIPSNNVTLSTFTLIGSSNYGIKPSGVTGITIQDITVQNSGGSGIDLNTVTNSLISNVEVTGTTAGSGVNLVDCDGITLQDVTSTGNDWLGIAIEDSSNINLQDITTDGNLYGGVAVLAATVPNDNIVFSGTNNLDDISDGGGLLPQAIELGFYTVTTGGSITNLVWPSEYLYKGLISTLPGVELYVKNFATASDYAYLALAIPATPRIIDLSTGSDAVPHSLFISIDGGSTSTNNPLLSLGLSAANTNEMRFSCDNATWTGWEPYAIARAFDLTSVPGCNVVLGLKTVYFEARNFFNYSAADPPIFASDDIILLSDSGSSAGTGTGIGISVNVTDIIDDVCYPPVIYKDHTARIWEPNDQTAYTAAEYGTFVQNKHGYTGYEVSLRQDYVFTGETLKYFVIIEDVNGVNDIVDLRMVLGDQSAAPPGTEVGQCAAVADFADISAFVGDNGQPIAAYDPATMRSYVCTLIVQAGWTDLMDITFRARDGGSVCAGSPNIVNSTQSDWINFNPELGVSVTGNIDFGDAAPGSTAMSTTIYVENDAEDSSGVIMDMYIASSDYFTDPLNPDAICGAGNGIRYDQFEYYATKGSVNSGANNNLYPGLGESSNSTCIAGSDEFTPLPSHSGHIEDMCRIINYEQDSSLLAEGAEMSLTFKLDVPTPCDGFFTDGQFWIVGRAI